MQQGAAARNGAAPNRKRTRERLLAAMLEESGERGFERVRQRDVEVRAGAARGAFGDHFADREECFALAFEAAAGELSRRMLRTGREAPFRRGLSASVREMLRYLGKRPALARALLVEAHAAGPQTWLAQRQAMARLSDALDRAARRAGGAPGRPAITASYVAGAMASVVRSRVARGEAAELERLEPELVELAMLQFFPAEAPAGESAAVF